MFEFPSTFLFKILIDNMLPMLQILLVWLNLHELTHWTQGSSYYRDMRYVIFRHLDIPWLTSWAYFANSLLGEYSFWVAILAFRYMMEESKICDKKNEDLTGDKSTLV